MEKKSYISLGWTRPLLALFAQNTALDMKEQSVRDNNYTLSANENVCSSQYTPLYEKALNKTKFALMESTKLLLPIDKFREITGVPITD